MLGKKLSKHRLTCDEEALGNLGLQLILRRFWHVKLRTHKIKEK